MNVQTEQQMTQMSYQVKLGDDHNFVRPVRIIKAPDKPDALEYMLYGDPIHRIAPRERWHRREFQKPIEEPQVQP